MALETMKWLNGEGFRGLAIKTKLQAVIVLSVLTIAALGFAAMAVVAHRIFRQSIVDEIQATARLVGEYCVAPLAFGDPAGESDILAKASRNPNIGTVAVLDRNQKLFAQYGRQDPHSVGRCTTRPGVTATGDSVLVVHPLMRDGEPLGTLCVEGNTARVRGKLLRFVATLGGLLVVLLLPTLLLARQCARWVAQPLLDLTTFVRRVAQSGDYGLRGRPLSNDEIGTLCKGFNELLDQIQRRDHDRASQEEELLRARKIESLGVLAGGIAHDFNNLLTAVVGNISLARDAANTADDANEFLRHAEAACFRARDLTRQLLTFSKGGAPIRRAVSLGELVRETVGFVLRGSNVTETFSESPDLWPAQADEGQVSQVIQNLVINAKDAMPHGGTVDIALDNATLGEGAEPAGLNRGRYVRIKVTDHGSGIAPDVLNHIFDPYFTTKSTGTGLGLAVCYSIVKRHDGSIAASSPPDAGATFEIYLPAADVEPAALAATTNIQTARRCRILVMDDDAAICELCAKMARHLGHEAVVTHDGNEAVSAFREARERQHPFDIVILDLTIPGGMGGKEVMRLLRQMDPLIRGIVASGYSSDPVLADFAGHGFASAVAKPFVLQNLEGAIRDALDFVIPGGSPTS